MTLKKQPDRVWSWQGTKRALFEHDYIAINKSNPNAFPLTFSYLCLKLGIAAHSISLDLLYFLPRKFNVLSIANVTCEF